MDVSSRNPSKESTFRGLEQVEGTVTGERERGLYMCV